MVVAKGAYNRRVSRQRPDDFGDDLFDVNSPSPKEPAPGRSPRRSMHSGISKAMFLGSMLGGSSTTSLQPVKSDKPFVPMLSKITGVPPKSMTPRTEHRRQSHSHDDASEERRKSSARGAELADIMKADTQAKLLEHQKKLGDMAQEVKLDVEQLRKEIRGLQDAFIGMQKEHSDLKDLVQKGMSLLSRPIPVDAPLQHLQSLGASAPQAQQQEAQQAPQPGQRGTSKSTPGAIPPPAAVPLPPTAMPPPDPRTFDLAVERRDKDANFLGELFESCMGHKAAASRRRASPRGGKTEAHPSSRGRFQVPPPPPAAHHVSYLTDELAAAQPNPAASAASTAAPSTSPRPRSATPGGNGGPAPAARFGHDDAYHPPAEPHSRHAPMRREAAGAAAHFGSPLGEGFHAQAMAPAAGEHQHERMEGRRGSAMSRDHITPKAAAADMPPGDGGEVPANGRPRLPRPPSMADPTVSDVPANGLWHIDVPFPEADDYEFTDEEDAQSTLRPQDLFGGSGGLASTAGQHHPQAAGAHRRQ
eukprot:TRINITY_DN40667_c0_g1_i1.p1 TRINITY_DN40667_c0_g1~~TRINITY_DN40667_c0_g1_i1.p1  ORF type:complete len:531 (-),score=117.92 TRINITY_DN40667_c0_g1_i1:271-1863(-)